MKRDNSGNGSCIDNVFNKSNLNIKAHKILYKISDHYPLAIHIDFKSHFTEINDNVIIKINFDKLKNLCSLENFNNCLNTDINKSVNNLVGKIKLLITAASMTSKNNNKKNQIKKRKDGITNGIVRSCNIKNNL